jgi:hypothetical protein
MRGWIRTEVGLGVLVTAYSALLGGAVGLIWQATAPRIQLAVVIDGSESAARPLIGDDVRLGLLGLIAGVAVAVVVVVSGRGRDRGPGEVIGLAVGGVLGALVAARVGQLGRHDEMVRTLATIIPGVTSAQTSKLLGYFGFQVRATGVLMLWPIAAVGVHLLATAADVGGRRQRVGRSEASSPVS